MYEKHNNGMLDLVCACTILPLMQNALLFSQVLGLAMTHWIVVCVHEPWLWFSTQWISACSLSAYTGKLTRKVFGFEQTYRYEILVTRPLSSSECAGECLFL